MSNMYQQTNSNSYTLTTKRKILYILSFAEFWDNVNFFGTVAVLVLYATKVFLLPDQLSYSIYGIYLAMAIALEF
jgi:dipeptide/tripeptide permease